MSILERIKNKLFADLYSMISCTSKSILDKTEWFYSQVQSHAEYIHSDLDERTDRINSELQEQEERLKEQTVIINELQKQISQLSVELQNQNEIIERSNLALDEKNTAAIETSASVLSVLNGMLPYFPLIRSNEEEIVANVNSIYSFCLNEAVKRQVNIEETDVYQYYKKMHHLTACHKIMDDRVKKRRIGRQHDGGYVMIEPFSSQKIAYSVGICDDVSWDKEMAGYGYEVYQYDHTIISLPEENEAFHWKKIGLTGLMETDELKKLDTVIRDNGHENCMGMVLKMDIEGYEWDLLRTCDQEILNQFDQIIMEIHWLNDSCSFDKIIQGLEKLMLSHAVVHIHGNNYRYTTFCGDMITPDVMEITLIKRELYHMQPEKNICMGRMDQVNRPNSQDIWIGKW